MIPTLLFVAFVVMMLLGVPIGAALGLAGAACIALANSDAQWFGLLAVPQNFYAGLGKYPLLAIPMFVLVGSIFDRSGVALRLVNFAVAIVGRGPGMLPLVAIVVAMFLGGISGSGPANAAAVGAVMIAAMSRAGYPAAFSASVVGAAAATDILIPPSVAFIVYSVLVPGASVPALFAAGMIPGVLAGLALIVPTEARDHVGVWSWLEALVASNGPIRQLIPVKVRQSMGNGGGPACLRLRVVADPATVDPRFLVDPVKLDRIEQIVSRCWPATIDSADLAVPSLWSTVRTARLELLAALDLDALA